MNTTTYRVTGMTCGHCVQHVTDEVSDIDGVSDVAVDLATGALVITSVSAPDDAVVVAAVAEAGPYTCARD